MAICNRDLDVSEQKSVIRRCFAASEGASASSSFMLGTVDSPAVLSLAKYSALGLSGAPEGFLEIQRFVVGAGLTQIIGLGSIGASAKVVAVGTSGMQGVSLVAAGSTLLNLQMGDVLVWRNGFVGSTAIREMQVECVIKYIQDIKATFGAQT